MIDKGLLLTLAVIVVSLVLAMRIWPPRTVDRSTMLDLATSVGVLGVVVGRLFFMALEDPSGLTRIGDILIVRSGMEFWAGAPSPHQAGGFEDGVGDERVGGHVGQ